MTELKPCKFRKKEDKKVALISMECPRMEYNRCSGLESAYMRKSFCEGCDENVVSNDDPAWKFDRPNQSAKLDVGKPQLSLVPMQIMNDIAIIREYGNNKYGGTDSWETVEPHRYIDAMLKHALEFAKNPNALDDESGYPHLWHLECNCAFLSEFLKKGKL